MFTPCFHPGSGNNPRPGFQVDFCPGCAPNLTSPGCCEHQKLEGQFRNWVGSRILYLLQGFGNVGEWQGRMVLLLARPAGQCLSNLAETGLSVRYLAAIAQSSITSILCLTRVAVSALSFQIGVKHGQNVSAGDFIYPFISHYREAVVSQALNPLFGVTLIRPCRPSQFDNSRKTLP